MVDADNQIGALVNVDKIASFINNSKTTQKVLRAVSDNVSLAEAGMSFVAASILRPAAQAALPIKDKEDKRYTIASSVATGVTVLALSAAIFIPANKLIQKTSKALYSSTKDTIYKENPTLLRSFKSLTNRFLKLALMPATSWLRFAAIVPCVKLLFGKKKEEKKVGGKLDYEG
jgi:hypothetical protein